MAAEAETEVHQALAAGLLAADVVAEVRRGQRAGLSGGAGQRDLQVTGAGVGTGTGVVGGRQDHFDVLDVLDAAAGSTDPGGDPVDGGLAQAAGVGERVFKYCVGNRRGLGNGLVDRGAIGTALPQRAAATHTLPAAGQLHGGCGVSHAEPVLMVVVVAAIAGPAGIGPGLLSFASSWLKMRKRAEILSIRKVVDTCLVDTFGNDIESLKNQLAFLPLQDILSMYLWMRLIRTKGLPVSSL